MKAYGSAPIPLSTSMKNEANTVAFKIAVFQHAIPAYPLELPFRNLLHGVGVRELLTMAASTSYIRSLPEPLILRKIAIEPRREPSWQVHRRQKRRKQEGQTPCVFHFAPKRAQIPKLLPLLLIPRAAVCSIRTSSERKSGKGETVSIGINPIW